MDKSRVKKTNSIRRGKHVSAKMVAEVVNCHPVYVNQVWVGYRSSERKKGEAIEVATILLNECIENGIKKAKQIIGELQNSN